MIEKKNPKQDLEKKRMTFSLLGLVVAIGASILIINWKTYDKSSVADLGDLVIEEIDEEEVTVTKEKRTPPPPPPPPPPPVVVVVEDNVEIKDEAVFEDVETDEEEEIEIIEEVEEEESDEVFNFAVVEDKPVFPGCEKVSKAERSTCFQQKLLLHIKNKFNYPTIAREMGIQEKIFVSFEYGKDGKVKNAKVVRGENPDLKKEALRLVKSLPKVTPAKQRGKPVSINYTIPIRFKIK
ncbi:MAG: energy transducer TonB [Flavobacteriales bacterium]